MSARESLRWGWAKLAAPICFLAFWIASPALSQEQTDSSEEPTQLLFEPAPPLPGATEQPAEPSPAEKTLIFGPAEPVPEPAEAAEPEKTESPFSVGLDRLWLEAGGLLDRGQDVDTSNYLHGAASARWEPDPRWELRLGVRLDGYLQTGEPDFSEAELDFEESFIRYRGERSRLTLGAQTVIWGRVDEIPPLDRLSVQDLNRFILDDLAERRRTVGAVRWERFWDAVKLDALWVPDFREAELPDRDSIWSPVDRDRGRFIGIAENPVLRELIRQGDFGEDTDGSGGGGARLSWQRPGMDYGLSVQRTRHSPPYYELNEGVRRTLLSGAGVDAALAAATGPTFVEIHPWTWVGGADLSMEAKGAIWRLEAAYLSDVPVTTVTLDVETVSAVDWVAGVEFFPGQGNAQVNLQLAAHHLLDAPAVLDREDSYLINGRYENTFARQRWRTDIRFWLGLDERDIYLNPELAYLGWEPHQFYVALHYFDGEVATLGGFHEDHSLITLGWRAEF